MAGNIKVKIQTTALLPLIMGTLHDYPPSKDALIHTRTGIGKTQSTQLKPEKIQTDELSYQPEKLYTDAILEILSKAITEEIKTTLKNECMTCYDPAVQVHFCYLNNPREKVDRNFDNEFQVVDLWSVGKTTFQKTEILLVVKDKNFYLTRSD